MRRWLASSPPCPAGASESLSKYLHKTGQEGRQRARGVREPELRTYVRTPVRRPEGDEGGSRVAAELSAGRDNSITRTRSWRGASRRGVESGRSAPPGRRDSEGTKLGPASLRSPELLRRRPYLRAQLEGRSARMRQRVRPCEPRTSDADSNPEASGRRERDRGRRGKVLSHYVDVVPLRERWDDGG